MKLAVEMAMLVQQNLDNVSQRLHEAECDNNSFLVAGNYPGRQREKHLHSEAHRHGHWRKVPGERDLHFWNAVKQ